MAIQLQNLALVVAGVLLVYPELWTLSQQGQGRRMAVVEGATQNDYYSLMDNLFAAYKPEVRPTFAGEATYLFVALHLLSIQDLDERSQVLETSIILEAVWLDSWLSWNQSQFGNVSEFLYPQSKIWLPDVIIENSVESQKELGYKTNMVRVDSDGWIHWKPSQVIKTSCDIDVTYYPFDTQTCSIIVSTWMSTQDEIDIDPQAASTGLILDKYSSSGTWELVSNSLETLANERNLTRVQFKLKLKRLTRFYVLNIILPVLFLSFTASLVFFLPADAGEKIGMGITVLLAYAVYLTIIADNMPQTSLQVSYLAVYLTLLLGLTAMGVVLAVVVLHIHHKPDDCTIGERTENITRKLRNVLYMNKTKPKKNTKPRPPTTPPPVPPLSTKREVTPISRSRSKATVRPVMHIEVSPPPSYSGEVDDEIITWPKVAETVDRVMFIFTSSLIFIITIIFIPLLGFGA
ncbi:hypothetical protein EGW08_004835 [Elysia chlorotica]|uniref:Neurotransmitter-gated ion-channel ligand-binding domain-containing protein n=1 Tax=Elysia chlorotica TaxID=188477 RepID=A0A433U0L0_ELYCH|nr:hypothetical protein EGW08_004835 [Elysia chlorotica]